MSLLKVIHLLLLPILFSLANANQCDPKRPVILRAASGVITSPGYDGKTHYPGSLSCPFLITSNYPYYIRLTFNDFDLDDSPGCTGDHLEFQANPKVPITVQKICGRNKPRDILFKTNTLLINFFSDFIGAGRGFNVTYSFTTHSDVCDQPLTHQCVNRNCVHERQLCDGHDDCGDASDESHLYCRRQTIRPKLTSCGKPKIQPITDHRESRNYIVGGDIAKEGSWPWMADLQLRPVEPSAHTCGGALIHPQYVLTATHCIAGMPFPSIYKIILGNHYQFNVSSFEQVRYVNNFVAWPNLTPEKMSSSPGQFDITHDMTLLKLNAPVTPSDHVSRICLPESQSIKLKIGTRCFLTGWGETRGSGDSSYLKQLEVTVRDLEECQVSENLRGGPELNKDTMICLKPENHGNGACAGDSGGPLVCEDQDGTWTIHGVASFVTDSNALKPICGSNETAVVYNSVAAKLNWINQAFNFLEGQRP